MLTQKLVDDVDAADNECVCPVACVGPCISYILNLSRPLRHYTRMRWTEKHTTRLARGRLLKFIKKSDSARCYKVVHPISEATS